MRGRPVIQWILFACLWAGLVNPIVHVTRGRTAAVAPAAKESSSTRVWVSVRFSGRPEYFVLEQGDVSLWAEDKPVSLEYEREIPLVLDKFGTEVTLKAKLDGAVTAVEVKLEPEGLSACSRTVWVEGDVEELISFSWGNHD
ncbi:MAG: hypothetical protein KJ626_01130 [Verrucomicrobia bacterium]|nr:hypothetical protein [Verrucomicrobiota bacterium]